MAEELKTSRDGTPTGEMVAEWLRANGYDGLCNPDAGCGCGFDDLMPCNQASDSFCVCAYEVPDKEGRPGDCFYCVSNGEQDEPSDTLEAVARDMWVWALGITTRNWTIVPERVDAFGRRLRKLGVTLDEW